MTRGLLILTLVLGVAGAGSAETNFELQAVKPDEPDRGTCIHPKVGAEPVEGNKVVIEGICLNNPEDMTDPATQWQIFVQGEGADLGGTAVWAGKFYQGSAWEEELSRLNGTGFREGDRVRVSGYAMAVGGKANINERHSPAPPMNFELTLLEAGVGLPAPELTTIAEMNTFDPTRLTGGERLQCRRIRINHVRVQGLLGGRWGSNADVLIADNDDPENPDKQILLALRYADFGSQPPATWFHVVGLGNQEPQFEKGPIPGTGLVDGYQVWVTRPDGIIVPGDCTLDGRVDYVDLGILATHYDACCGASWQQGDFDDNGLVGYEDLGLLASNYDYGTGVARKAGEVPEPAAIALLGAASAGLLRPRNRRRRD